MTKARDFLAALQHQRSGQSENVADYWKRQQSLWLADLSALQGEVKRWLAPILEARAVVVEEKSVPIMEPDLGSYDAPVLEITLLTDPSQVVQLRPRGLRVVGIVETGGSRVIGASGRVDLECGVKREILLRFRKDEATSWYSFSAGNKRELNEELFFELLARIADIRLAS